MFNINNVDYLTKIINADDKLNSTFISYYDKKILQFVSYPFSISSNK